jgi:phospholipase/lecithinase/hemolysin
MVRRVPVLLVVISTMGAWEDSLLEVLRVSRLIEGGDTKLLVGMLPDDSRVSSCVKRSHENEGNVHLEAGIQTLNQTDVVLDF